MKEYFVKMGEGIRKFGLEDCDLPTMVWNSSVLLRCLALNIDSQYKKRIPAFLYVLIILLAGSYLYVYLFSMIWFVFIRSPETGDLIAAMVFLSLGISSEIGMVKLIFMFIYNDKLKRLVDEYLACDSLVEPGSRFSHNLLKTLRIVKTRAMVYWSVLMMNALAYSAKPIVMPGRHLFEDLMIIYGLEPMYESPNFEIATILMGASIWFISFTVANITAFIIIIAGYTEAQMLALSEEVNNIWKDVEGKAEKTPTCNPDTINEYIKERLVYIIKAHAKNVLLLGQVEHVFTVAIVVGFLCLIVGLIAELLGGLENTYLQTPFALVQVGMDCFIGQRIIDANAKFETAVYNCKWEYFDKSNMRIVLLMLQNSQKTMMLSAGGMATLSFKCLMAILRSVYSAYTTLRPMMND